MTLTLKKINSLIEADDNSLIERNEEGQAIDWLAIVMGPELNDTDKVAGTEKWNPVVAELKKEINSIEAEIADWKSRVYKANNHTYHNRDEEAVTTYGRINENRRKKAINRLNSYLKTETEKLEKVTNHMEHYSF